MSYEKPSGNINRWVSIWSSKKLERKKKKTLNLVGQSNSDFPWLKVTLSWCLNFFYEVEYGNCSKQQFFLLMNLWNLLNACLKQLYFPTNSFLNLSAAVLRSHVNVSFWLMVDMTKTFTWKFARFNCLAYSFDISNEKQTRSQTIMAINQKFHYTKMKRILSKKASAPDNKVCSDHVHKYDFGMNEAV